MTSSPVRSELKQTQPTSFGSSRADSERIWIRYEKRPTDHAFTGSLQLILEAVARDQQADAVCLYEYVAPGNLVLRETVGAALNRLETANLQLSPDASAWLRSLTTIEEIGKAQQDFHVIDFPEVLLHRFTTVTIAPVRDLEVLRGVLTVGWKRPLPEVARPSSESLQALVNSTSQLLLRRGQALTSLHLIREIARLEIDLADLKIAERAVEYVNGGQWGQKTAFDIQEHVSRILESADINRNLRDQLAILQSRLQDRQVLARAKARLQSALGLNEENAYLFLRNSSRRTRRPLRDIAEEVLSGDSYPTTKPAQPDVGDRLGSFR